SIARYFWQTWGRTGIAALPFAAGCYLAERWWPAHNLPYFFLQIAAILPLFAIGMSLAYRKEASALLRSRLRRSQAQPELGTVAVCCGDNRPEIRDFDEKAVPNLNS
ncbi:MAG TPA: hypothetical protein VKT29_11810, partial [Terriglobales bacterium]|nr:hypothetical protein [Terriglobales bacterium]